LARPQYVDAFEGGHVEEDAVLGEPAGDLTSETGLPAS
jgi:hypothetical protein